MMSNPTTPVLNSLLLLSWNCNGLQSKIHELRSYLVSHPSIDIILLQEVKTVNNINIPNYTLHHTPREGTTRYGGTAIYIKNNIPHFPLQNSPINGIDYTSIVLDFPNRQIHIASVYVRHGRPYPINQLNSLFLHFHHTFIAGDFNARHRNWNCHATAPGGTAVHNLVSANNYSLHAPRTPTHFQANSHPSIIDLAISNNFPFPVTTSTHNIFNSDHLPVSFKIDIINPISPPPSHAINWKEFYTHLENNNFTLPNINSPASLEDAIESLENSILDAQTQATFHYFKNDNQHLLLPPHIHQLIKYRNNLRRRFQITRDPSIKPRLNRLSRQIKNKIRDFKQKSWEDFLDTLTPEDNSLWKLRRRLNANKSPIPPITVNNRTAYTDEEKANFFADAYEKQFSPNPTFPNSQIQDQHINNVKHIVDDFLNNDIYNGTYLNSKNHPPSLSQTSLQNPLHIDGATDPVAPLIERCTGDEIRQIVIKLKPKKSPGIDKISNKALKNLPQIYYDHIANITNSIFDLNYYPNRWKTSITVPIPKGLNDYSKPENFRPISLLPSISKVIERVIRARLLDFTTEHNIIIPEQFGFRAQHSTSHQLLRVVEFLSANLNDSNPAAAVFLDVAKAFDKVWHTGLIYKMLQIGFNPRLIRLIHSYLSRRLFCVRINNTLSTLRRILAGILQGSALGPFLFNIYFNDIPRNLYTLLALYADDMCIYAADPNIKFLQIHIQQHIDTLMEWCLLWRIKINNNKCHAIFFSYKLNRPSRILINDIPLDWETNTEYLGVTLDNHLTWKKHIANTRGKAASLNKSTTNLIRNAGLSINNKLLLYNQCILPKLTYAIPVWGYAAKSNLKRLCGFHNNQLRKIRNGSRYLRNTTILNDLKTKSFPHYVRHLSNNFYKKINDLNNEIIAGLPDYEVSDIPAKRPRYSKFCEG